MRRDGSLINSPYSTAYRMIQHMQLRRGDIVHLVRRVVVVEPGGRGVKETVLVSSKKQLD